MSRRCTEVRRQVVGGQVALMRCDALPASPVHAKCADHLASTAADYTLYARQVMAAERQALALEVVAGDVRELLDINKRMFAADYAAPAKGGE